MTCPHTWVLDRPESDTWECLDCGHEGHGTGPNTSPPSDTNPPIHVTPQ